MLELDRGIRIKGTTFWLDGTKRKDCSFISHAHSDHLARHQRAFASPPTVRLAQHRLGVGPTGQHDPIEAVAFGRPFTMDGVSVELLPAGHILGSAQILIQNGHRFLYTGDFKLEPSETAEPIEIKPCDVLIMECTFGRPAYVFPRREVAIERLVQFVEETFKAGAVPILLAYLVGKSQEVAKILGDRGYHVVVPEPIEQIIAIYREFGVQFQHIERFREGDPPDGLHGKVLVCPPHFRHRRAVKQIRRQRTAMVTGWAVEPEARRRFGVDEAIPLSDHADFNELLAYVEQVKPAMVYTLHGTPDFAARLRRSGIRARHIERGEQLSLLDDLVLNVQ